jgi:hypothetical protein
MNHGCIHGDFHNLLAVVIWRTLFHWLKLFMIAQELFYRSFQALLEAVAWFLGPAWWGSLW